MSVTQLKLASAGDDQLELERRVTFDEFYKAYPRKRARKAAIEAWAKVSIEDRSKILAALAQHKKSDDWRKDGGKFIPYPASWLRGERWDDQLESDLGMGQCSWNMHGNRSDDGRCSEDAVTEKRGVAYCKRHGDQVRG